MSDGLFVDSGETFAVEIEDANENKYEVVLRRSNAGRRASISEKIALRCEEAGLSKPPRPVIELVTVQASIASWTLPEPLTDASVSRLTDDIIDYLFTACALGRDPKEVLAEIQAAADAETGEPDPTGAAATPPTSRKRQKTPPAAAPSASDAES
jgi:hypothetical protein